MEKRQRGPPSSRYTRQLSLLETFLQEVALCHLTVSLIITSADRPSYFANHHLLFDNVHTLCTPALSSQSLPNPMYVRWCTLYLLACKTFPLGLGCVLKMYQCGDSGDISNSAYVRLNRGALWLCDSDVGRDGSISGFNRNSSMHVESYDHVSSFGSWILKRWCLELKF